ncbi:MAG: adenine phosphoribosyltransferase [Ruminococcaceae bacterium]|nr:adenine phosphoribosyltransferase [Oscillospiraceae bacterium]
MDFHEMTIAGLRRELPLCPINDKLDIAAFVMFGDVEITVAAARDLLEKAPEFDIILTPEAKSIPLAYEMSRQSGKPYIVARKGMKLYMTDPIEVAVKSITTANVQHLFISSEEADRLMGRRVMIVDDVISTGESLKAVEALIAKSGGTVACKVAVLAEGDAAQRDDIIFLEPLPLFFKED